MSNLGKVKEFMLAAGQTVRTSPEEIPEDDAVLRVKLIFEEAFELAAAAGVHVLLKEPNSEECYVIDDKDLAFTGNGAQQDLVEIADALADIEYVTHGASHAWGLPAQEVFDEVQDSNMTKFIDGYRRDDGKWIKGPSYRATDIAPIIERAKNG